MNYLYVFVPLNSQTAHLNEMSVCILFAKYGFNKRKSRKDLSLVSSKYGSCCQTLCDLTVHIVCYYVQRYNFYNTCYNFPIVFRNVYHQRCTTTDVCSHGPKENKSKTDTVWHKASIQLWLNAYQCFHYKSIFSRVYILNIKICSVFKYAIQGLR